MVAVVAVVVIAAAVVVDDVVVVAVAVEIVVVFVETRSSTCGRRVVCLFLGSFVLPCRLYLHHYVRRDNCGRRRDLGSLVPCGNLMKNIDRHDNVRVLCNTKQNHQLSYA